MQSRIRRNYESLLVVALCSSLLAGGYFAGVPVLSHYWKITASCSVGQSCDSVWNGQYSKFLGTPVALFGCGLYLLLLILLALTVRVQGICQKWLIRLGMGLLSAGSLVSIVLQVLLIFGERKTCGFCSGSALAMLLSAYVWMELAKPSVKLESIKYSKIYLAPLLACVVWGTAMFTEVQRSTQLTSSLNWDNVASQQLLRSSAATLGNEEAGTVIVEFADPYCSACRIVSPSVEEFVKANPQKVRLVYRHLLLPQHQLSALTAGLLEIAKEKGKFWEILDALRFSEVHHDSSPDKLFPLCQTWMSVTECQSRLKEISDNSYAHVREDLSVAKQLGIKSAPTFIIISRNQQLRALDSSSILEFLKTL